MKCLSQPIYLMLKRETTILNVRQRMKYEDKKNKHTLDGITLIFLEIIREKTIPANLDIHKGNNQNKKKPDNHLLPLFSRPLG